MTTHSTSPESNQVTILFRGSWQMQDEQLVRHMVTTVTSYQTISQRLLLKHTPLVCIAQNLADGQVFIAQCVSNPHKVITARTSAELAHKLPELWQPRTKTTFQLAD